ncbi:MAG: diguanylate cyclase [Alphaproteobacteria bacterium]|nr:diguanylate cyclase [Alphaproteobacteria bacterium]
MDERFGAERRFRDFVEIAGDFAWEIDSAGRFVFAAPRLVHGWPAQALVGRKLADFLADPADAERFAATAPAAAEAVGFRDSSGGTVALAIWARPVFDATGVWNGARGIARDMADAHARDVALNEARQRGGLLRHVVRAVRDEPQPEAALTAALTALGLAIGAAGGAVFRYGGDGSMRTAAGWGAKPPAAALPALRAALERDGCAALTHAAAQFTAQAVVYRGEGKGAVLLWRSGERAAFDNFDHTLLGEVADHLGIVLAQIEARERIDHLSRTDHLTGVANRTAFFDEFARRLSRIDRTTPSAALLYVDVTNLKLINALRGPAIGDSVLTALAVLLREHTRPGDLIARFGGGEFVLWIERIDAAGAWTRATALQAAAARLASLIGRADLPFGVGVGVALFDPLQPETAMQLVLRAAAGAARAKEQGGERWPASLPA